MKLIIPALLCLSLIGCQGSDSGSPTVTAKVAVERTVGWSFGDDLITIGVAKPNGRLGLHIERLNRDGCGVTDVELSPGQVIKDMYGENAYAFTPLPSSAPGAECLAKASKPVIPSLELIDEIIRQANPNWGLMEPYDGVLQPIPKEAPRHHRLVTLASTHAIIARIFDEAGGIYLVFDVETERPVGLAVRTDTFADTVPIRHVRAQKIERYGSVNPLLITDADQQWRIKEKLARCLKRKIENNRFYEATALRRDPLYREHILDAVEKQDLSAYPDEEVQLCRVSH